MYPLRNILKKTIIDRNSMLTRPKSQNISVSNLDLNVKHDNNSKKFYIELDSSEKAFLEYDQLGNVINFYETYVPDHFRGRGIASKLAEVAFDHAIKENHQIQLSCTFLQKYYHENYEKYKNYVLDDEVVE